MEPKTVVKEIGHTREDMGKRGVDGENVKESHVLLQTPRERVLRELCLQPGVSA